MPATSAGMTHVVLLGPQRHYNTTYFAIIALSAKSVGRPPPD